MYTRNRQHEGIGEKLKSLVTWSIVHNTVVLTIVCAAHCAQEAFTIMVRMKEEVWNPYNPRGSAAPLQGIFIRKAPSIEFLKFLVILQHHS